MRCKTRSNVADPATSHSLSGGLSSFGIASFSRLLGNISKLIHCVLIQITYVYSASLNVSESNPKGSKVALPSVLDTYLTCMIYEIRLMAVTRAYCSAFCCRSCTLFGGDSSMIYHSSGKSIEEQLNSTTVAPKLCAIAERWNSPSLLLFTNTTA